MTEMNDAIRDLGVKLRKELNLPLADLDNYQSIFFKKTYIGLPRTGKYMTEAEMNELRKLNT